MNALLKKIQTRYTVKSYKHIPLNYLKMRTKIYLISFIILLMFVPQLSAQTDNVFWFAAPDISWQHGNNGIPLYLHTNAVYATTVTISRPADPSFTPFTYSLAPGESRSILLLDGSGNSDLGLTLGEIECNKDNLVEQKGFLIEAYPGEITAFYEMNNEWNRDIFALKGKNGLGQRFTVTTQNIFHNANTTIGTHGSYYTAKSGFVIVATENNTEVTILANQDFDGAQTPGIPFVIHLNKGETYHFQVPSAYAWDHPQGVKIWVSNASNSNEKKIAVTIYDDSMSRNNDGSLGSGNCLDTFGDQYIPNDLAGREYIVLTGMLGSPTVNAGNWRREYIFITAISSNTIVKINGINIDTLAAREVLPYQINQASDLTYVSLSNPGFVNHITGGGYGCEQGGAILPPIDKCTGSYHVTFSHSGPSSDDYALTIMARNDTVTGSPTKNKIASNFTLYVQNDTFPIPTNYFEYTSDSAFIYLKDDSKPGSGDGPIYQFFFDKIPTGSPPTVARISNTISKFHLGVLNGGAGNGGKYGYFSDYAANSTDAGIGGAYAPTVDYYCSLDPIRLVAVGGKSYEWNCTSNPAYNANISDRFIADPYFTPDTTSGKFYTFSVFIDGECSDTTINLEIYVDVGPTSDFKLSNVIGCSPLDITITNNTNKYYVDTMTWIFEPPYDEVGDDGSKSFVRTFQNTTDTIQTHYIRLYSYAEYNLCPNVLERSIKVLPEVSAGFAADDSSGCNGFPVTFDNLSTGHLDSTSFNWNFGDQSQSFDFEPTHFYENYSDHDTTFTVQLIVESPLHCKDSASLDINVAPHVSASFSSDTNGCSPITFTLDPKNSFGADSLFWNIDYIVNDSIYETNKKQPIKITHRDTTAISPDTLKVFLVAQNTFGCRDTSKTRDLRVFPEIKALMDVSDTAVCDSVPILFTNISQGSNMTFKWDFGDNTNFNDNTLAPHTKIYLNRTDSSKQYRITLKAKSNFECESETDTTVTVFPYISTDFGVTYTNNCSPLKVTFEDASHRVHQYFWHLEGDSVYMTDSDSTFYYYYNNPDLYNDTTFYIKLVGENNEGCSDSITRSVKVFPPVVAKFTPVDTAGCAPLLLPIKNSSTGGILLFNWDYGDGIVNSNPLPSFTKKYNNFSDKDTTFKIRLVAATPVGCSDTMTTNVTVFAEVRANFTMPVYDSCSPFKPRITNLSTPGSKYTAWYKDVLGDSIKSFDWNPDLGYFTNKTTSVDTIDIYLVAYQLADPEHQLCADTHMVPVLVFPELDAGFTLDKTAGCQPFISSISNTSNITSASTFRWYLDNTYHDQGVTPRDLNIPNETPNEANHTLWMYGRTNFGCRDTASQAITVHSRVYAEFNASPSRICSGDSVFLDRKGSAGGLTSYFWNFNNEGNSLRTDTTFYHTFENLIDTAPLTKFVTLTVANDFGCDSSMTKNIIVDPKVTAAFDPDFAQICYPHNTVFRNNSKNALTYSWVFGDGTSSSQASPSHKYKNLSNTSDKTFDIKLVAESVYRCADSITKQVTIFAKPYANFDFPVSVDCPPFEAYIADSSIGTGLSYSWDFAGDGNSDEQSPVFTFENTGSSILDKPITLIITSDKNCKDTLVKKLRVYPEVIAEFSPSVDKGCSPLLVNFDGFVKNAHQLQWLMDGKTFSTVEDPVYNFNNETPNDKLFKIRFIAKSIYTCSDTMDATITVYASPITDFIALPNPAEYNTEDDRTPINFSNETVFQDNWTYEWDYGDGNFDNQDKKDFTYNYGAYFWGDNSNDNQVPIRLVAWNKIYNQCRDTIYHNVRILPPEPQVDLLGDIDGCQPFETKFKAITKYVYDNQFEWYFGDGQTSNEKYPIHEYNKPGLYTVKLVVRGDGGTKWDSKEVTVHPMPIVDFTFSDSLAYVSSQTKEDDIIQFYNHTKYGSTWEWYFDKRTFLMGAIPDSYEKEPSYAYPNIGVFYAVLIATSEYNCSDTLIQEKAIVVKGEGYIAFPTGFFLDPTKGPADEYNTDQVTPNMYLFYPASHGVDNYKLEVYNRWGTLVFESNDVNRGWNGYIDGVEAKQDVYVWRCHGVYTNGEKFEQSGDVTLLKTQVNVDVGGK
jgi:PKD repeat protein